MTLLGNAVQPNEFALAPCGSIGGGEQDSRKAKGKKMTLLILIGQG